MKKYIFILIAFMLFATAKAQVSQDTTNLVTVKDTTYVQDARLNFFAATILPAINSFIEDYNSKEKLAGNEITKKQDTNQFVRKYEKALTEFQAAFIEVKNVQVDSTKIVTEFQALEAEYQRISNDKEIKLSDYKKRAAEIRLRQAKLSSYYNQLTN